MTPTPEDLADFLTEVRAACQQEGVPLPTFVANYQPGDAELVAGAPVVPGDAEATPPARI